MITAPPTTANSKSDASDAQFIRSTLPLHAKMFEKHRVRALRRLLQSLLDCELRYHCRVVEELSAVRRDLALIDEEDEVALTSTAGGYDEEDAEAGNTM